MVLVRGLKAHAGAEAVRSPAHSAAGLLMYGLEIAPGSQPLLSWPVFVLCGACAVRRPRQYRCSQ